MNIVETLNNWGVWPRRALALVAGAFGVLGFAPFHVFPAYALALSVLVCLLDAAARSEKRIKRGFGVGLLFGFGQFAVGMNWVSAAFNVDSGTWGPLWGIPAALLLALLLALFWGAGCALAMLFWTRDWRRIGVFAAALGLTEWLRGHMFGGLPWLLPAYVWTPGEPISQVAALGGVYALSIATLAVLATPAIALTASSSSFERLAPVFAAALVIGLAWGWGARRLQTARLVFPGAAPIVRVVDSGLTQAEKWDVSPTLVLQRFVDASNGPQNSSRAEVLVWPEGAVPWVNAHENAEFMNALGQALGDRVVILGLTRCEPVAECNAHFAGQRGTEGLRFYNSAAVIDGVSGHARVSQIYDKNKLVPGGEFIPFWSFFRQFNIAPLQQIGEGFTPGPPPGRLVVPGAPPVTPMICYEAIFPGFAPRGEERPGWLASLTNDAWFGNGLGPAQHYDIARYRSIEEGLPMARAASGGVSAIIDAYGRATTKMTHASFSAGVEAQLPPSLPATVYIRSGSSLTLAVLLLIAGIRLAPRRVRLGDVKQ